MRVTGKSGDREDDDADSRSSQNEEEGETGESEVVAINDEEDEIEEGEEEEDDEEEGEEDVDEGEDFEDGRRRKRKRQARQRQSRVRKRPKNQNTCENCGFTQDKSLVSSQHRWGAVVRSCIKKNWSMEEHQRKLEELDTNKKQDKDQSKSEKGGESVLSCPIQGCRREFAVREKAMSHLQKVHSLSIKDAKLALAGKLPSSPRASKTTETAPNSASTSTQVNNNNNNNNQSSKAAKEKNKGILKLRDDIELRDSKRVHFKSYKPLALEEYSLGVFKDNFIRWDDSCRTRVNLLPLEPPSGSRFMEGLPSRVFRLSVVDGKLSSQWNDYLENEPDVVFGTTRSQRLHEKGQTLSQKLGLDSTDKQIKQGNEKEQHQDTDNPSSDPSQTEWGVYSCRDPPRMFYKKTFGVATKRGPIYTDRQTSSFTPIFRFPSDRVLEREINNRAKLHPIPASPPEPPSMQSLEESIWVEEASRMIRAAGKRVKRQRDYEDPFVNAGLPEGLEVAEKAWFEKVFPELSLLYEVADAQTTQSLLERVDELAGSQPLSLKDLKNEK